MEPQLSQCWLSILQVSKERQVHQNFHIQVNRYLALAADTALIHTPSSGKQPECQLSLDTHKKTPNQTTREKLHSDIGFCLSYRSQIGVISCHNFSYGLEKWFPSRVWGPLVIHSNPQNHRCSGLLAEKLWRLTTVHCFNFLNDYWLGIICLSIFFQKTKFFLQSLRYYTDLGLQHVVEEAYFFCPYYIPGYWKLPAKKLETRQIS